MWHGRAALWLRVIIYVATPLVLALVFGEVRSARELGEGYLGAFLVGGSICAMFELAYFVAWPRMLRHELGLTARIGAHAITIVVAVSVGAMLAARLTALTLGWQDVVFRLWLQGMVVSVAMIAVLVVVDEISAQGRAIERRAIEHREAAVRAELAALQARTDPQFLFDTLASVGALIPADPVRAELQLERLAAVFRYALEAGRHDSVAVTDELDAATAYLELGGLPWTVDRDADLDDVRVPPLVLQPVIEHAIRQGAAEVVVTARRRGDVVVLGVSPCPDEAVAELRARLALTDARAELANDGIELVIPIRSSVRSRRSSGSPAPAIRRL